MKVVNLIFIKIKMVCSKRQCFISYTPVTDSFMPHDVLAITRLVLKTRTNTERRTVLITNKIYKYWLHVLEKIPVYFLVVLPYSKFILVSLPAVCNKFRAIVACWCLRSNYFFFPSAEVEPFGCRILRGCPLYNRPFYVSWSWWIIVFKVDSPVELALDFA